MSETEKYECDYCGDVVPRKDVTLIQYPGYREKVRIPLCKDCNKHPDGITP